MFFRNRLYIGKGIALIRCQEAGKVACTPQWRHYQHFEDDTYLEESKLVKRKSGEAKLKELFEEVSVVFFNIPL